MIRFLTAGESHGEALTVIAEGFPSNIPLTAEFINQELKRRQGGYGRGGRMKIESDEVRITAGVRFSKTLGTPISLTIFNRDWKNWEKKMSVAGKRPADVEKITVPRPGHADLTGVTKYNYDDIRNSIERSSARETAARVAAGAIAKRFLAEFGIAIGSFVESIGGVYSKKNHYERILKNAEFDKTDLEKILARAEKSEVRTIEKSHEKRIIAKIDEAKKTGNSLGGTCVIIATGLPAGLGSFVHYDRRLDTVISKNVMSINAVKGIEFGLGFKIAEKFGSEVHDEIIHSEKGLTRKTNFAGGTEGGISTGLPVVIRVAMKPIATLMRPLDTIDLKDFSKKKARRERSDTVAVPACGVVAEAMLAWSIAETFVEKFGGDSLEETRDNYKNYVSKIEKRLRKNFG
jgi:chorismate synthase